MVMRLVKQKYAPSNIVHPCSYIHQHVRVNHMISTSQAEKRAAPRRMYPRRTRRQVVMGMVTRERSSTSLNLTVSSMLLTDKPDFLELLLVILSNTELVELV